MRNRQKHRDPLSKPHPNRDHHSNRSDARTDNRSKPSPAVNQLIPDNEALCIKERIQTRSVFHASTRTRATRYIQHSSRITPHRSVARHQPEVPRKQFPSRKTSFADRPHPGQMQHRRETDPVVEHVSRHHPVLIRSDKSPFQFRLVADDRTAWGDSCFLEFYYYPSNPVQPSSRRAQQPDTSRDPLHHHTLHPQHQETIRKNPSDVNQSVQTLPETSNPHPILIRA